MCRNSFSYFKGGDFGVNDCPREGKRKTFEDAVLETLLERNHRWGTVSNLTNAIEPRTVRKMVTIQAKAWKNDSTA